MYVFFAIACVRAPALLAVACRLLRMHLRTLLIDCPASTVSVLIARFIPIRGRFFEMYTSVTPSGNVIVFCIPPDSPKRLQKEGAPCPKLTPERPWGLDTHQEEARPAWNF